MVALLGRLPAVTVRPAARRVDGAEVRRVASAQEPRVSPLGIQRYSVSAVAANAAEYFDRVSGADLLDPLMTSQTILRFARQAGDQAHGFGLTGVARVGRGGFPHRGRRPRHPPPQAGQATTPTRLHPRHLPVRLAGRAQWVATP